MFVCSASDGSDFDGPDCDEPEPGEAEDSALPDCSAPVGPGWSDGGVEGWAGRFPSVSDGEAPPPSDVEIGRSGCDPEESEEDASEVDGLGAGAPDSPPAVLDDAAGVLESISDP